MLPLTDRHASVDLDERLGNMSIQDLEGVARNLGVNVDALKAPTTGGRITRESYGTDEGQTFWNRMRAGFKSTPKEKFDFYKTVLGPDQVSASQSGEILWKHPQKGWQTVDESGVSWGDLADLAGDVPEIAAMAATARMPGGAFLKGAVGSFAGNLGKQAVEQVIPGRSEASAGEAFTAGLGGGVANKAGEVVGEMIAKGPMNMIRDKLIAAFAKNIEKGEGLGSKFARESMKLSEKFDVPLTSSQITQGPFEKTLAGYAARSPFGIAAFEEHETLAQRRALEASQRLLDRFGPRLSEKDLGATVRKSLDETVARMENQLYRQAEKDFTFLDRALGGRQVIPAQHLKVYLETQAQRYMANDMPLAAQSLGRRLMKEAESIPDGMISARALHERLKRLGQASYGKEPLFDSVDFNIDKAGQMRLAKEGYQALLRDLDEAATGSTAATQQFSQGPVARLLRQARQNYESNMAPLDELRKSTLARFGYSPATQTRGVETMAQWFLKPNRNPSEVQNAMELLRSSDPEIADRLTHYLLDQAVMAGREGGKGTLAGFDRRELMKNLPRPEILDALQLGRPGAQIGADIAEFSELLARSLWQGGQRPVLQESPYKTVGSVASQETMFGKGRAFLERILTPQMVARFETDPEARQAIYQVVKRIEEGIQPTRAMESQLERVLARILPATFYESGVLAKRSQEQLPPDAQ